MTRPADAPGRTLTVRRATHGWPGVALLALSVVTGAVFRLAIQSRTSDFMPDSCQILLLARSLAAGEGFRSGGALHPDLTRPPLFPMLVAAASWVTGDVETGARLAMALAGALTVIPLFFLARIAFGRRASLAAVPLGAFSCLAGASGIILSTAPFVLFSVGAVAAGWSGFLRASPRTIAVAGALAAASSLTRSEGLVLTALMVLAAALFDPIDPRSRRRWWKGGGTMLGRRPVGSRRRPRGPLARCLARVGWLLVGFVVVYGPYAVWVSARLGRWSPAPSIEYLVQTRDLVDRLGLRHEGAQGVAWADRALFLTTPDHSKRMVESYFESGVLVTSDEPGNTKSEAAGRGGARTRWEGVVERRAGILRANLRVAAYRLRAEHFLPPVVVALGALGVLRGLRTRRGRASLVMLAAATAASLAPLLSHVEGRFFYLAFSFGLVVAAEGWCAVDRSTRRLWRWAPALLHTALAAAVFVAGLRHVPPRTGYERRFDRLREVAAEAESVLPEGPMLAVQPFLPYWTDRPYRAIPLGGPDTVLQYASAQGATALVLEGDRDLLQRPDLRFLSLGEVPPGFELMLERPHPLGGTLRLFRIPVGEPPSRGDGG